MTEDKKEKVSEDLKEKAEEQLKVRSEDDKEVKIETPLEEVKRIAEETKKIAESNKETMQRLEEVNANISLAGRSNAGQIVREKTQDEKDQEAADKMMGQFS